MRMETSGRFRNGPANFFLVSVRPMFPTSNRAVPGRNRTCPANGAPMRFQPAHIVGAL